MGNEGPHTPLQAQLKASVALGGLRTGAVDTDLLGQEMCSLETHSRLCTA